MESHIYYLTQRPAGPGTLPVKGLQSITTQYEKRTYIHAIKAGAWARAEYVRKLTDEEVSDYELTYSPRESTKEEQTTTSAQPGGIVAGQKGNETMNKTEIITAIMELTDAFKKSHLTAKSKDELAEILTQLSASVNDAGDTPADAPVATQEAPETPVATAEEAAEPEISADEKKLLAMIPAEEVDKEMVARPLIKQYSEAQKVSIDAARKIFRLLRKNGLLTSKGKADGVSRTTFQLTAEGIQVHAEALAG